jgi:hypothetical protein
MRIPLEKRSKRGTLSCGVGKGMPSTRARRIGDFRPEKSWMGTADVLGLASEN